MSELKKNQEILERKKYIYVQDVLKNIDIFFDELYCGVALTVVLNTHTHTHTHTHTWGFKP